MHGNWEESEVFTEFVTPGGHTKSLQHLFVDNIFSFSIWSEIE